MENIILYTIYISYTIVYSESVLCYAFKRIAFPKIRHQRKTFLDKLSHLNES